MQKEEVSVFSNMAEWSASRGIIHKDNELMQFAKLGEELGEIAECLTKGLSREELGKEIGDLIQVATNLAEINDLTIPECAQMAYDKIKDRNGYMIRGSFVKAKDLIALVRTNHARRCEDEIIIDGQSIVDEYFIVDGLKIPADIVDACFAEVHKENTDGMY